MAKSDKVESREANKQETATRQLSLLARELGPGAKLPRFLELRERLGISATTLTTVLDDLEAQGVITRRHGVGIYVSEHLHRRNVVLLCDPAFFRGEEVSPFWDMLVRYARERAAGNAEDFALHFTRPENALPDHRTPILADTLMAELRAGRVHGILGVGVDMPTVEWIIANRIPFVAFAGYGPSMVWLDEEASVRMGVEMLAARGCKRIGLWSSVSPHRVTCRQDFLRRPALTGFPPALEAVGLPFDPALMRTNAHLCPDDPKDLAFTCGYPEGTIPSAQEQGRQAARDIFGMNADPRLRPDGIVCTEDSMMQGALPVLTRLGVRLNEELYIATHANAGSAALFGYEDVLIRLEVDPAHLVREMYALLEEQMDGRTPEAPKRAVPPVLRLPESEVDMQG